MAALELACAAGFSIPEAAGAAPFLSYLIFSLQAANVKEAQESGDLVASEYEPVSNVLERVTLNNFGKCTDVLYNL